MLYGTFCMEGGYDNHWFPEERASVDQPMVTLYKYQPPLFNPRLKWPNARQLKAAEAGDYSKIPPFPSFEASEGSSWELHAESVEEFLVNLTNGDWATGGSIFAILEILTRGIENIVAVIPSEMIIQGYPIPPTFVMNKSASGVQAGQENCSGRTPFGAHAKNMFSQRDLQGRRFWVTLINFTDEEDIHSGQHWALGIFDRRSGVFYFLDPINGGRQERAKATGLMWRNFLGSLQLPYHFLVVAPDISNQRDGYECGYIACFNMVLMFRCLIGMNVVEHAKALTCRPF